MKALKLLFTSIITVSPFYSYSNGTSDTSGFNTLNPLEVFEKFNISYGNTNDQVLDCYLTGNRNANIKTILLIHGGGLDYY